MPSGIVGATEGGQGAGEDKIANVENLDGTEFMDVFIGDAAANRLRGFGGADQLTGGEGNDLLNGGDGDDTLNDQNPRRRPLLLR